MYYFFSDILTYIPFAYTNPGPKHKQIFSIGIIYNTYLGLSHIAMKLEINYSVKNGNLHFNMNVRNM